MRKRIFPLIFFAFIFLLIFPLVLAQVPPDKSLIKSSDSPKVYWFQNNVYYWILDETTFNKMSPLWSFANVIEYPAATFNSQILNNPSYKQGPNFLSDNILIKKTSPTIESTVFLTHNNQRRAFFNYDALIDPGYNLQEPNIISVTQTLKDSISSGDLIYAVGSDSGRTNLFRDAFNRAGGINNLGYARTTTQTWGTGQIQYFKRLNDNSAIVYNPNENYAYPTYGAIYTKYTARGANIYGFPIGDISDGIVSSVTGAKPVYQRFRGGSNTETSINHHFTGPRVGLTVETHSPILEKWAAMGYGASCAGLPISDVYSWQNGVRADFENGYIYWDVQRTIASCEPTQDECAQGTTRCQTSSIKQTCGNYDADVWLEWGNDFTCAFGCDTGTGQCNQGASCSNGVKDPTETDIDCGGSCSACPSGKSCSTNTDCQSIYCNPNNICSTPSCTDGWVNGNEAGIDCGGNCPACQTPACENPTGENELTANAPSGIGQHYPAIAIDPLGNFVVTWHGSDGSGDGIFAQRFNADGSKAGNEFRVNTYTTNGQQYPDIAMDANGNFVITWESYGQDGSSLGIYAQRFNGAGIPQGPEFKVNTYTTDPQSRADVAMDANGNFVITWISLLQDGSGDGIFAQRFDSQGNPQGLEVPVNQYTVDQQRNPAVAMDANGNFVITWASIPGQSGWGSIYAQRYDKNGNALGNGNFEVNTHHGDAGSKKTPSISMDAQGNFVITWASIGQDGSDWGIFARRFDKFGSALTSEIPVNTYTFSDQFQPAIAMDSQGNFVISWRGYGGPTDGFDIFARRFDLNGNPLSGEFDVNVYAPNDEDAPAVAMTSKTNFIIVWYSWRQDNQYDVIYRTYKCAPLCSNGAKDPTETDIDCGGSCSACLDGKMCSINNDCQNNYCNPNKVCSIPSCTDGWRNGNEAGIDCGGSCNACPSPECNPSSFPELFIYDTQKNQNLYNALSDISLEFGKNKVDINEELLAPIITTLQKEVGGAFLPIEEGGDYGMGPNCTYKVQGQCRSTPYEGGVDYKGRGYIQITHKGNYEKHCGFKCVGTSTPELDICGCKNQWHCTVNDESICPQIKALKRNYAGKIFASYYVKETYGGKNIVTLSYEKNYWSVGKRINGGDVYADDFKIKADNYFNLLNTTKIKTQNLISCLSTLNNIDSDNDGLINSIDNCPFDDDCDDDGLIDGNKGTEDANINGIVDVGETDPEAFDTDGDGISDGVERGITTPQGEDTDSTMFVSDSDPFTTSDPANPDSDGDGLLDGQEDKNQNGGIDAGESSPTITDTDLDTIEDSNDNCPAIINPEQQDVDINGIGDACEVKFLRGDSNTDGKIDISDGINIFNYLFLGIGGMSCLDAGDVNDGGEVDISDGIALLNFLFLDGDAPKLPYPNPGIDSTNDVLTCASYNPPIGGGAGGGSVQTVKEALNQTNDNKTIDNKTKKLVVNYLESLPKGALSITSSPSSAYIYLDGTYKGLTPQNITNMTSGNYTLKLSKFRYYDYVTTTNIQQGQRTEISIKLQSSYTKD